MTTPLYSVFEELLRKDPAAPAVNDMTRDLSRQEFDRLADTIAAMIPEGETRVGIVMDHTAEMIAAIFAAVKCGIAYIPVEPAFPDERIHYMMKEGNAGCVITNYKYRKRFSSFSRVIVDAGLPIDANASAAVCRTEEADPLAYILYTSGSTGRPKGVAVSQENVCHYIRAFEKEFHPGPGDVMLQHSVCSFDIFVEEMFTSLLNGAALAVPTLAVKSDIRHLLRFIEDHGVTMLSGFPYLAQELNELPALPPCLRLIISGGDVLRASYVDRLVTQVDVYNTYGPSETTVCASYYNCTAGKPLEDGTYPIGRAVLGSSITIEDEEGNPVPDGEVGELVIRGGGVSRGYINSPAEMHVFVETKEGTIYKSGDLGYVLPDGNIAFLHRKDTQVMIYGKRVEPNEVENALLRHPDVIQGAVIAHTDENDLSYLTAYVVFDQGTPVSELRTHLSKFLAPYMIPEFFVSMPSLPLNSNGKLDVSLLPVVMKKGDF